MIVYTETMKPGIPGQHKTKLLIMGGWKLKAAGRRQKEGGPTN